MPLLLHRGREGYEERINAVLGSILRNFNFLKLNLGLCIRFLENPKDPEKSHPKLARTSIQDKLDKLKQLLTDNDLIKNKPEFDAWYAEASEARSIRNYYVHGTWKHLPLRSGKPLGFRLPPWRTEHLRGEEAATMSLNELEEDAKNLQSVFEQFIKLRRKYGV